MTQRHFDVFLSHNSLDKPLVERIAERLKRAGIEPWLDVWCLVVGAPWQVGLAEGLAASRSCAVFVGPNDLGAWANQEVAVALDRAAQDPDFRLFLVLLPGVPARFEAAGLSPFLRMRTWVDFRGGLDDPRAFEAFVAAVKGLAPGPAVPIEPADDVCPYRGLEVFDEEHAEFFFGRDADVQRLLEKLKGTRFLAVLGASGSGKSSLVRAGLIPALRGGEQPWQIIVLRPGARPLEALAAQVTSLGGGTAMQETLSALAADVRSLHLAASLALVGRLEGSNALFVVDQFEEVFTLCRDDRERSAFVANLLYAATIPHGPCGVILTMRADFYHHCAAHPELAQQLASQQYLVSPLQLAGLRQAIEEPARRVGLTFEPGLVATILDDVADQPGALPLLEHALFELWRRRSGGILTLGGYQESGGVQGAIAKRAEDVFASLGPDQQDLARRTFLRLTQPGEGTEDTRRRAPLTELEAREADVASVLGQLVSARLIVTSRDEAGEEVVEVSHEALIRGWPRLRGWVDEDRAGLRVHRRISEAAREWQRLAHDDDVLFSGVRLSEVLAWRVANDRALNELEREFVDESERREVRQRRRLKQRRFALVAAVVSVLLASITAVTFAFRQQASNRREQSRDLAARAAVAATPEQRIRLAVEAMDAARTEEAEVALRRALLAPRPLASFPVEGSPSLDPAGRFLVNVTGNQLAVRNIATGHITADTQVPKLGEALFDPTGTRILAPGPAGTVLIWQASALRELQRFRAHRRTTLRAVFSGDGRYVVTVGADEQSRLPFSGSLRLRLWDSRSGKLLRELGGEREFAGAVVTSPDGRFVAVGGDGVVEVWRLPVGKRVARLPHFGPRSELGGTANPLAFSRDGALLATGAVDGATHMWDTATWTRTWEVRGQSGALPTASFSPTGNTVALTDDRIVRVLDADSGKRRSALSGHVASVSSVSFSRDGRLACTSAADGTARVWEPQTGEEIRVLQGAGDRRIWAAWCAGDGRSVVTTSEDDVARIWRLGAVLPRGDSTSVERSAFSPDGATLLTQSGPLVRIWEAASGRLNASVGQGIYEDWINPEFSPDSTRVLTAGVFAPLIVWDARSGERLMTGRGQGVNVGAFSPDSTRIVGADDGGAGIWDAKSGKRLVKLRGSDHDDSAADFSSDGRLAVTAAYDGIVRVWDPTDGTVVHILRHPSESADIAAMFAPVGDTLLTVLDGDVRVWGASSGAPLSVLKANADDAAFSPDATLVLTWGDFGTPTVWDARSGKPLVSLNGHEGGVAGAAFSPDGETVATAGADGTVRLWATRSGQELGILTSHQGRARVVAFAPTGRWMMSAGAVGSARLYECTICAPIDQLLALARRVGS